MILLLSFCSFPWWLAWLLPFLLGLLAGWAIWSRYKVQVEEQAREISSLQNRISSLESDLEECKRSRIEAKGRIAQLETELSAAKRAADDAANRASAVGLVAGEERDSASDGDQDPTEEDDEEDLSNQTEGGIVTGGFGSTTHSGDDADDDAGDGGSENDGGSDDEDGHSNEDAESGSDAIDQGHGTGYGDPGTVASGFAAGATAGGSGGFGDTNIYSAIPNDNLQIIEGIGPKMESVLKENGVTTWSALAAKTPVGIRALLGEKYTRIIDPTTWAQQAARARNGEWEELISLQKTLDTGRTKGSRDTDSKLEKVMIKMGLLRKFKQDDLKAIEGIGPKIESLLHDAGITTWRMLSETAAGRIQEILDAAGSRFKLADPKTWPKQAELAAEGKFKELQIYQDELTGGR